jgi:hypothetical protein
LKKGDDTTFSLTHVVDVVTLDILEPDRKTRTEKLVRDIVETGEDLIEEAKS